MASDGQEGEEQEQQQAPQRIQIFPTPTNAISPFWRGFSLSLSLSLSLIL